ncbi:MAG TPA: thiol reductant ABC exporter subunit CydC, partial [Thermomicrobiales bacterium]|nr:thiol reductant ABC exporter subunit CydC [Thermomicrobiales bacterium]
ELSPGELRRVAFGRALARLDGGANLLLLDEPTAHLDASSAETIRRVILGIRARGDVTIVMVAHESHLREIADVVVPVGAGGISILRPMRAATDHHERMPEMLPVRAHPDGRADADEITTPGSWRDLVAVLQPWRGKFLLAVLFGVLASLAAISLAGVSGWLIVRASQQPPIMYLLVAIVGVRFFGIGRAVSRYAERLWLHDAVFATMSDLRVRIWRSLAALGPAGGRMLRGERALDRLIGDVDRVRDLAPRVVLPPIVGLITAIATTVALGVLLPASIGVMAACAVVALVVAPMVALRADRKAKEAEVVIRSRVIRRLASFFAAASDLRVNGLDGRALREIRRLDTWASVQVRRSALASGLGSGIVTLSCVLTSVVMLAVAAPAVKSGEIGVGIVAVLVLTPLALIDPFLGALAAIQQWPALRLGLGRVAVEGLPSAVVADEPVVTMAPIARLEIDRIAATWPDRARPVFSGLTADLHRGDWLAITGPSGAGKSTLLATLLGFLRPSAGSYRLNGVDARTLSDAAIRIRIAWCPQESHLFDSSLRANLLLARPKDVATTDAEMIAVLNRVGLGGLLASLPAGLETRIGAAGTSLSGGQ